MKHLINVLTNGENIILNLFCFIQGGAGAGPLHRLRLLPKSNRLWLCNTVHTPCCGAGAGTFWSEPEPVCRSGSNL